MSDQLTVEPRFAQPKSSSPLSDLTDRVGGERAKTLWDKLTGKQDRIRHSQEQLDQKRAELDKESAEAAAVQERLHYLQIDVERAADQLTMAEGQLHAFKATLAALRGALLESWGNTSIIAYHGADGPNYSDVVRIQAAVDDWPRVRAHLSAKVETAQKALANFSLNLR